MKLGINAAKQFYAGLIYVCVGLAGFFLAQRYQMGTATRMGPGYFPALISLILAAIGCGSLLQGLTSKTSDPIPHHKIFPLFLVLGSVVAFALLIERAGLVVAISTSVFIACAPRLRTHPFEVFLTAAFLSAFCAIVFVYAFSMTIPLFP